LIILSILAVLMAGCSNPDLENGSAGYGWLNLAPIGFILVVVLGSLAVSQVAPANRDTVVWAVRIVTALYLLVWTIGIVVIWSNPGWKCARSTLILSYIEPDKCVIGDTTSDDPGVSDDAPPIVAEPDETPVPRATEGPGVLVTGEAPMADLPCSLDDWGIQLLVDKADDSLWVFDPENMTVIMPDGEAKPIPEYTAGCNILVEGRKVLTEEHHIWILRANGDPDIAYLETSGQNKDKFVCAECSVWIYPTGWNMQTRNTGKPSIAEEFVDAKRLNMQENATTPYDWPIFVHTSDGSVWEFGSGEFASSNGGKDVYLSCSEIEAPERLEVTGLIGDNGRIASIGATGCTTLAWVNQSAKPFQWQGAADNFPFQVVEAWMMPTNWDQAKIDSWVASR
jgi:hypothetical protein